MKTGEDRGEKKENKKHQDIVPYFKGLYLKVVALSVNTAMLSKTHNE